MLHPYGARDTTNLDSLRSARPTIGAGGRWGNFITITSSTRPAFDRTWLRLSPSSNVEKYLSMDGSELSYVPAGDDRVARRACHSGAIVLVKRGSDAGTWTILIPRMDPYEDLAGDGVGDPLNRTHPRTADAA